MKSPGRTSRKAAKAAAAATVALLALASTACGKYPDEIRAEQLAKNRIKSTPAERKAVCAKASALRTTISGNALTIQKGEIEEARAALLKVVNAFEAMLDASPKALKPDADVLRKRVAKVHERLPDATIDEIRGDLAQELTAQPDNQATDASGTSVLSFVVSNC